MPPMTGRPSSPQHLRDLALLRRVRDRIDREYARPLDVEALARDAHMSAGHFSRQFRLAYGESPRTSPSGPTERRRAGVISILEPWKYLAVNSGIVIASQMASGVERMNTW